MLFSKRLKSERVSFSLVAKETISKNFQDVPETLWKLGRPGLAVSFREHPDMFNENLRQLEQLLSFSSLLFADRAACAEALSNDLPRTERLLSWWIGAIEREVSCATNVLDRRKHLQLLQSVSATLRDLRRFPASTRLTLEHLFFFRKSVMPLFVRNIFLHRTL